MSQNPYQAPPPATLPPNLVVQQYEQLPWYRKSGYVSVLTLLGLCCGPAILTVCIIVLTGDVYYNTPDASGNLKKWGYANKVVAVLILVVQVIVIGLNCAGFFAAVAQQGR